MNFNLEISSDLDYEGMVVNIVDISKQVKKENGINKVIYKQRVIAILNQEKGINNIEIKIFVPTNGEFLDFSYKDFMEVLEKAKKMLIQINK